MRRKIIYFTRFMPDAGYGGGSRRMMQILEVLKDLAREKKYTVEVLSSQRKDKINPKTWDKINAKSNKSNQPHSIHNKSYEYRYWSRTRRAPAFRLGEISRWWIRKIPELTDKPQDAEILRPALAVMDDPIYFFPLFERLKQCGIPVAAVCHNLETLAPTQVEPDPKRTLFIKELDLLQRSDLAITISREETALLLNIGAPVIFYPYFPAHKMILRLLKVREKRMKERKKGILLLGNALNLQTRQGMEKMIYHWHDRQLYKKEGKLIAAGFKTEEFLKEVGEQYKQAVDLRGTLSEEELDELLVKVKAALFYQEAGGGALTRITEMQLAQVLVLANSHAARSYYQLPGILEFRDLHDLEAVLDLVQFYNENDVIPKPIVPGSKFLYAAFEKLLPQE